MSKINMGILLPEQVLSSNWFALLATVVALNTIIYVGLTFAKVIPWPKQFHPNRVRAILAKIRLLPKQQKSIEDIRVEKVAPESTDPYENFRMQIARKELPLAFALVGVLLIPAGFIGEVLFGKTEGTTMLFPIFDGVVFLFLSILLSHTRMKGKNIVWIWVFSTTIIVALTVYEGIRVNEQAPLATALIVLTAFSSVCLSWKPAITGFAMMFSLLVIANMEIKPTDDVLLLSLSIAAGAVGLVLLQLRIRTLNLVYEQSEALENIADKDYLTNVLSRHGIQQLLPGFAANSMKSNQNIFVTNIDIVGLKKINENYGSSYGDRVLQVLSQVLQNMVGPGDLLARFGGDEFLIVGVGTNEDTESLKDRIETQLVMSSVALGKQKIKVKVASTCDNPKEVTFDQMLQKVSI